MNIIFTKKDPKQPDRDSNITIGKTYTSIDKESLKKVYGEDEYSTEVYIITDDRGSIVTKWKWKFTVANILDEELFTL